jgi:hypothetical protein
MGPTGGGGGGLTAAFTTLVGGGGGRRLGRQAGWPKTGGGFTGCAGKGRGGSWAEGRRRGQVGHGQTAGRAQDAGVFPFSIFSFLF